MECGSFLIDREGSVWVGTTLDSTDFDATSITKLSLPNTHESQFAVAAGDKAPCGSGTKICRLPIWMPMVNQGVFRDPSGHLPSA